MEHGAAPKMVKGKWSGNRDRNSHVNELRVGLAIAIDQAARAVGFFCVRHDKDLGVGKRL